MDKMEPRDNRGDQNPQSEQGGDLSKPQGGTLNADESTTPMSLRKKGFIITGVIVLILIGIIIGVRYFNKDDVEESAVSVVPVEVAEVQTGDVTKTVKLTGFVTPRSTAKLIPKLPAKISTVHVDVGDRVSKGQVLAKLDDSDIKAYQKAAEASMEAARLGLKAAAADLENARSVLEQVLEKAKQLPDPSVELPEGIELPEIPEKKDLERAKVDYKNAQADYALAEAKLKEAETALESVRRQSNNTEIISPINGVVAARLANQDDMASPLQPILVVIDDTEMLVAAGVTENNINSVTKGMELQVLVKAAASADGSAGTTGTNTGDSSTGGSPTGSNATSPNGSSTASSDAENTATAAEPEQLFTGKVVTISPVVDEKTRMFTINISIPNPDNKLRAGMSAEVQLTTAERRGVVRVPLDAVVDKGDDQVVYIIEQSSSQTQSRARERRVETGLAGQDYIEIISGLTPGETIVTKGQHFLRDGAQVNIKNRQRVTTPVSTASRGQSWCRQTQSQLLQTQCQICSTALLFYLDQWECPELTGILVYGNGTSCGLFPRLLASDIFSQRLTTNHQPEKQKSEAGSQKSEGCGMEICHLESKFVEIDQESRLTAPLLSDRQNHSLDSIFSQPPTTNHQPLIWGVVG
ncbi:MAG: efflux RND transporter periplasmic adaptor subunit [Syntrophaceticus schinkii]|jgi:multidrug efflux pump subunit AcrA (membrane-fusion protein)|nr:efflux RND transporter periplasmic adaptor subunit [Syntrophaceticus schinkii]MDD4675371.1 efflux RND transporter periplasmic adaptor subunit [Syntrophaceticus schinkii]